LCVENFRRLRGDIRDGASRKKATGAETMEGLTMADGTVTEVAAGAASAGTDAELIRKLQEALAVEQAKNQVLMEQLMKAEDGLADKDLEGYADVVEEADRPFWRGQLLENREAATGVLERMRGRTKTAGSAEGADRLAPRPLHNRAEARVEVAGAAGGAAGAGEDRAAKIRNRAQEVARRDGVSFSAAFRLAEQELGAG
jgi:hypothetical protein